MNFSSFFFSRLYNQSSLWSQTQIYIKRIRVRSNSLYGGGRCGETRVRANQTNSFTPMSLLQSNQEDRTWLHCPFLQRGKCDALDHSRSVYT